VAVKPGRRRCVQRVRMLESGVTMISGERKDGIESEAEL
jgi:hypothetical protein